MNDLVSIIMPSYNSGAYIRKSIESVIAQTYKKWELLIIDDCSTDDTKLVVDLFLDDKRIKFIRNKSNVGAAASRNLGIRQASGKWVAFLDSDDLWKKNKLEMQIRFMENNYYHFSYTNYSEIDKDDNLTGVSVTGPRRITRNGFLNYCWPGCLTVMYDAELIGLIQIKNIKKNNDYAMWLRVCRKADCYLLDEDLAFYRRGRDGSISSESIRTMIGWHYKMFRDAEGQSVIIAVISTVRNLLFGLVKKLRYVRKA